jgi:hypothetical protein
MISGIGYADRHEGLKDMRFVLSVKVFVESTRNARHISPHIMPLYNETIMRVHKIMETVCR